MKKVALFGDSILRGVVLNKQNKYCFADVDWQRVEKSLDVSLINKSRFGCEITKGQKIINDFLHSAVQIDVAVVEYGGNDSDFFWNEIAASPNKPHNSKTQLVDFEQKLRTVVRQLQAHGIRVALMSLPPLEPQRYLRWISQNDEQRCDSIMAFLGDVARIYRYQETFSNAVTRVALQNGCDYIDVRQKFLQSDCFPDLMCADGVHPNENGQRVIMDAFVDFYSDTALAKAN